MSSASGMTAGLPGENETRVLLLAPTRRDAEVTRTLLQKAALTCQICPNLDVLVEELERGAGAILTTEETVLHREMGHLLAALDRQPTWSDLPVVLLIHGGVQSPVATRIIRSLRNVTLLERPAPTRSVISAVQAAIRGRLRQYQIRDQIEAVSHAEARSRQLQAELAVAIEASELGTFHCEIPLNKLDWNDRCKAHFWLPPEAEVDPRAFLLHPAPGRPRADAPGDRSLPLPGSSFSTKNIARFPRPARSAGCAPPAARFTTRRATPCASMARRRT